MVYLYELVREITYPFKQILRNPVYMVTFSMIVKFKMNDIIDKYEKF